MKRLVYLIKWLPFALVVLMVLHCLLLLCGIHSNFLAHNGVSPLLYVVMLVLSYKLDFCCFHPTRPPLRPCRVVLLLASRLRHTRRLSYTFACGYIVDWDCDYKYNINKQVLWQAVLKR